MPLQVGITGGIGSGKSLVCRIFQVLGVPTYDADSRAKSIMTTDGILISDIRKEFGELSYHPDGSLNRAYLGSVVFNDPVKLARLNTLVHPRVGVDYNRWVKDQGNRPYVVKEAALLFESGSYKTLNAVIVVRAPEALRIERVLKRDPNRSRADVDHIIHNQMPEEKKAERADYVIWNDDQHLVIPQVLALHKKFSEDGRLA